MTAVASVPVAMTKPPVALAGSADLVTLDERTFGFAVVFYRHPTGEITIPLELKRKINFHLAVLEEKEVISVSVRGDETVVMPTGKARCTVDMPYGGSETVFRVNVGDKSLSYDYDVVHDLAALIPPAVRARIDQQHQVVSPAVTPCGVPRHQLKNGLRVTVRGEILYVLSPGVIEALGRIAMVLAPHGINDAVSINLAEIAVKLGHPANRFSTPAGDVPRNVFFQRESSTNLVKLNGRRFICGRTNSPSQEVAPFPERPDIKLKVGQVYDIYDIAAMLN